MRPPLHRRPARSAALTLASLLALHPAILRAQEPAGAVAEMKPYVEPIPNSTVTFQMIPIPGGTFEMGSPEDEPKRSADEGPRHPVTIGPFWMGRTEVTWDEFDQYIYSGRLARQPIPKGAAPQDPETKALADAVTKPTGPYVDPTFGYGHGNQPAISMTHHAAMEYCRWLSAKTSKTYRLPTEAEWEYVCRSGTTTAYSFGDDAGKLDEYAWSIGNCEKPMPVAGKKPNPWGLYDMHGNVGEWCFDAYVADAYEKFPVDKPSLGPVILPTPQEYPHVVRGGSWDEEAAGLRSAVRRASNEAWRVSDPGRPQSIWWDCDSQWVGFRIVRPLEPQEDLKDFRSPVVKAVRPR